MLLGSEGAQLGVEHGLNRRHIDSCCGYFDKAVLAHGMVGVDDEV